MSEYLLRHVALSLKDGSPHKVKTVNTQAWLEFDQGERLDLDGYGVVSVYLAVDGLGRRWAVCGGAADGSGARLYCYETGFMRQLATGGANRCAIRATATGVEVYETGARLSDTTCEFIVTDQDGRKVREPFVGLYSTAEGIMQILGDTDVPVSTDPRCNRNVLPSVFGWRVVTQGPYTICQVDEQFGPRGSVGVVSDNGIAQMVEIGQGGWDGYTDQASRLITAPDGRPWIAIPGFNTPEPDQVRLVPMTRWAPPPPPVVVSPPPVTTPTPTPAAAPSPTAAPAPAPAAAAAPATTPAAAPAPTPATTPSAAPATAATTARAPAAATAPTATGTHAPKTGRAATPQSAATAKPDPRTTAPAPGPDPSKPQPPADPNANVRRLAVDVLSLGLTALWRRTRPKKEQDSTNAEPPSSTSQK